MRLVQEYHLGVRDGDSQPSHCALHYHLGEESKTRIRDIANEVNLMQLCLGGVHPTLKLCVLEEKGELSFSQFLC